MTAGQATLPWGDADAGVVLDRVSGSADHLDLPSLTDDELAAVGDTPRYAEVHDSASGDEPTPGGTPSAQRSLIARRLAWPNPAGELAVDPEVQVVLAIRAAPSYLTVIGLGADGIGPRVRAWGAVAHPGDEALVLLQRLVCPGVSDFVLGTADWAARAVATFALAAPEASRGTDRDEQEWTAIRPLETVVPHGSEAMRHAVYVTSGSAAVAAVNDAGETGPPVQVDVEGLTERLRDEWRRCAESATTAS